MKQTPPSDSDATVLNQGKTLTSTMNVIKTKKTNTKYFFVYSNLLNLPGSKSETFNSTQVSKGETSYLKGICYPNVPWMYQIHAM